MITLHTFRTALEATVLASRDARGLLSEFCASVRAVAPAIRNGQTGVCVTLPKLEDGEEVAGNEVVRLFCGSSFEGLAATKMPASVLGLARLHNVWELIDQDDRIAFFGGLGANGKIETVTTLTSDEWERSQLDALNDLDVVDVSTQPAIIDCFPNGWACLDPRQRGTAGESSLRWVSEELREPGTLLWPRCTLGESIVMTVLAVALGYHPRSLNRASERHTQGDHSARDV